jgi:hypothetical protein
MDPRLVQVIQKYANPNVMAVPGLDPGIDPAIHAASAPFASHFKLGNIIIALIA